MRYRLYRFLSDHSELYTFVRDRISRFAEDAYIERAQTELRRRSRATPQGGALIGR